MEFQDFEEENNFDNFFEDYNKEEVGDEANKVDKDQEILESAWSKSKQTTDGRVRPPTVRKPRPKLTEMELIQPNGLPALKASFDNFQLSDKRGPYENLDQVLRKMEYWAHNLYPQLNFENFLVKMDTINKKRLFKEALKKIRLGMSLEEDFNRDIEAGDVDDIEGNKIEDETLKDDLTKPVFVDDFYDDDAFDFTLGTNLNKDLAENEEKSKAMASGNNQEKDIIKNTLFSESDNDSILGNEKGSPVKKRKKTSSETTSINNRASFSDDSSDNDSILGERSPVKKPKKSPPKISNRAPSFGDSSDNDSILGERKLSPVEKPERFASKSTLKRATKVANDKKKTPTQTTADLMDSDSEDGLLGARKEAGVPPGNEKEPPHPPKQTIDSADEENLPIRSAKNKRRAVVSDDDENEGNSNIINVTKRMVISEDEDSILGDRDCTDDGAKEKPKNNEMDEDDVMEYLLE